MHHHRVLVSLPLGHQANLLLHVAAHLQQGSGQQVKVLMTSSRIVAGSHKGCADAHAELMSPPHLRLAELWIDELVASHKGDAQLCGHHSPATLDGDVVPLAYVVDVDRNGGICSSMEMTCAAPLQQTKVN